MSQLQDFIDVANKEVGYIEGPKDNETKYGKAMKANFLPWCGSFVNWCANQVGLKIPNCVSTRTGALAFKKQGAWIDAETGTPEIGDLAFFDFPNDGVSGISHIGIVIDVKPKKGLVITIEGNTSSSVAGSQRNGGEVCIKTRAFRASNNGKLRQSLPVSIVGFGRPTFKE